ncbi:hypothetical protein [Duganella sp. HH101]|uniref:hypothetical protein n=1 Tax=Duganella sp. HH101 TaxID=1781066 RepID=UPI000873B270|nr:hypothetical protein [Duganella sp. HH101]OFA06694.1 hypothetical protein DUGA2_00220 [Duganella sp. HH101]
MIEQLTIGISALGSAMLAILYGRIRSINADALLKKHRNTGPSLADLLIYAAEVTDGVIVGKNGSFMAAWAYKGDDNASSTDEYRERTSLRINQATSHLGSGWMIHVDAVRRDAPGYANAELSHFPDPVSAAIDEERRRLFEKLGTMYEGYFVLTLTYLPPLLAQSRFVEMMFDDEASAPDQKARTHALIDYFQRECANVQARLSSALKLERLMGNTITNEDGTTVTHDDFLRYVHKFLDEPAKAGNKQAKGAVSSPTVKPTKPAGFVFNSAPKKEELL